MTQKVTKPSHLASLAEKIIFRGLEAEELTQVVVLKPGKTFADFKRAWETPLGDEYVALGFEGMVANRAARLFAADVIEVSLVPNDDF